LNDFSLPDLQVPHSAEAEQTILGALLSNDRAAQYLEGLREDHFFLYRHRLIWRAVESMQSAGRTIDLISIFEQMRSAGLDEDAGGLVYLTELCNASMFSPEQSRATNCSQ
jgi:replicative DNA helicase